MSGKTPGGSKTLFAHLLGDSAPLVIHCTAGKDRTGFACALILHSLGVPEHVIAEDYLLTNRFYRRDPSASNDLPDDVRQVLGSVEASFLAAAFDAIRSDYGDLEQHFQASGLGLGEQPNGPRFRHATSKPDRRRAADPTVLRAFLSEVDTGSREENASKQ